MASMTNNELLRNKAFDGLANRGLAERKEYRERLEYELGVVQKQGFTTYFLVMWDIANWATKNQVLYGPGRGSGAGSLLNYCLRITLVDPLKYGLHFERFLNPDRVSPPDIDWDTAGRDKIISYIESRYGKEHVTRVGTLGLLRTKGGIRDVGRVLEKDYKVVETLAGLVPPPVAGLWDSFEDEAKVEPELLNPIYADIIEPVRRLWGTVRSYGTHAGGVAIAPVPINRMVPLYKGKDGNPVSQFDWRDLERSGLLKFDILGLKTLEVIQLTLQYLKEAGTPVDLEQLDDKDTETYTLIRAGDLDGVFQLGGSESIKQLTVAIAPESISDIALITSLFRPGPLRSGMANQVIDIRQGKKSPGYVHKDLSKILDRTYGVPVFQEQIMEICTSICGYTPSEADNVRKILGKKLRDKMIEERSKFVLGAVEHSGWTEKQAEDLFSALEGYASYLFNESHAVAYSVVTYWTAYLKAHYPVAFYAALLALVIKPDMITQYASAIREANIGILPPDINLSGVLHQPEGASIRFGLSNIKGMPSQTAEDIVSIRHATESNRFASIMDLLQRVPMNARAVECLGKSGALLPIEDTLNEVESAEHARNLLVYLREMEAYTKKEEKYLKSAEEKEVTFRGEVESRAKRLDEIARQFASKMVKYNEKCAEIERENLKRSAAGLKLLKVPDPPKSPKEPKEVRYPTVPKPPVQPKLPTAPRIVLSHRERVRLQREMLHLYLTGHPLDDVTLGEKVTPIKSLKALVDTEYGIDELEEIGLTPKATKQVASVCGVLLSHKVTNTKTKKLMARLRLEDKTGSIEVVAFPSLYETLKGTLVDGEIYQATGEVDTTTSLGDDGEYRSHAQIKGKRISLMKVSGDTEWDMNYPLLKGVLRILPGLAKKPKGFAASLIMRHTRNTPEVEVGSS